MAQRALVFLLTGLLVSSLFCGEIKADSEDDRKALALTPAEKAYVLGEMRLFVESIQGIAQGLAENDHAAAAEAAAARGQMRNQNDPAFPASLSAKLPPEWKQFGGATRKGFDRLATEIANSKEGGPILQDLSDLMKNCVACHASYRIIDMPN